MPYIEILKDVAPASPDANHIRVYAKADNILYVRDNSGTETPAISIGLVHYQVVARVVLRV